MSVEYYKQIIQRKNFIIKQNDKLYVNLIDSFKKVCVERDNAFNNITLMTQQLNKVTTERDEAVNKCRIAIQQSRLAIKQRDECYDDYKKRLDEHDEICENKCNDVVKKCNAMLKDYETACEKKYLSIINQCNHQIKQYQLICDAKIEDYKQLYEQKLKKMKDLIN